MSTSEHSLKLAGRLGMYLIASDLMDEADIDKLEVDLVEAKGEERFSLPR